MAQSAKAQEPSMEEILASIRRIIADDETKAQGKSTESVGPAPAVSTRQVSQPPISSPSRSDPLPASAMDQDDIDTMLSGIDVPSGISDGTAGAGAGVLDLTEAMAAPATPAQPPVFRTIEANADVFFSEEEAENPPEQQPSAAVDEAPPEFAQHHPEPPLLSSETTAAVDAAFNSLAHTVLVQNARTLEDLVREMMRPLLKAWLDDNLPSLVERMVRAEIERVSRGRQG
jgi:cell pole-organizing protein PopZ